MDLLVEVLGTLFVFGALWRVRGRGEGGPCRTVGELQILNGGILLLEFLKVYSLVLASGDTHGKSGKGYEDHPAHGYLLWDFFGWAADGQSASC
jgi:hypothetical protein